MLGIIKIIILFGIIIGTHEFGHFIVAKLCKVTVYEFSIGFGPKILSKQGKQTLYALRLIPLGGYVRLEGEEELSDEEGSFSKASKTKRLAILFAGAFVNIFLAIIVYFTMGTIVSKTYTTEIETFIENSPAVSSNLKAGDKIVEINGKSVSTPEEIIAIISNNKDETLKLKAERNSGNNKKEIIEESITPKKERYLSVGLYFRREDSTKIALLDEDSSLEETGLKINDKIVSINGVDVKDDLNKLESFMVEYAKEDRDSYDMDMVVERGNKEISIKITPKVQYSYYIGIVFKEAKKELGTSLKIASEETGELIGNSVESIIVLITGKAKLEQMSGPIGIADTISRVNGIAAFIELFALISLNIGLLNILPIPPLDGFKILLVIIEAIRKKPVSKDIEIKIELFGFMLLIMFSVVIAYGDILKLG